MTDDNNLKIPGRSPAKKPRIGLRGGVSQLTKIKQRVSQNPGNIYLQSLPQKAKIQKPKKIFNSAKIYSPQKISNLTNISAKSVKPIGNIKHVYQPGQITLGQNNITQNQVVHVGSPVEITSSTGLGTPNSTVSTGHRTPTIKKMNMQNIQNDSHSIPTYQLSAGSLSSLTSQFANGTEVQIIKSPSTTINLGNGTQIVNVTSLNNGNNHSNNSNFNRLLHAAQGTLTIQNSNDQIIQNSGAANTIPDNSNQSSNQSTLNLKNILSSKNILTQKIYTTSTHLSNTKKSPKILKSVNNSNIPRYRLTSENYQSTCTNISNNDHDTFTHEMQIDPKKHPNFTAAYQRYCQHIAYKLNLIRNNELAEMVDYNKQIDLHLAKEIDRLKTQTSRSQKQVHEEYERENRFIHNEYVSRLKAIRELVVKSEEVVPAEKSTAENAKKVNNKSNNDFIDDKPHSNLTSNKDNNPSITETNKINDNSAITSGNSNVSNSLSENKPVSDTVELLEYISNPQRKLRNREKLPLVNYTGETISDAPGNFEDGFGEVTMSYGFGTDVDICGGGLFWFFLDKTE